EWLRRTSCESYSRSPCAPQSFFASADGAELRRVLAVLQLALELATARPGARQLPADAGGLEDGQQSRAVSGRMALKPCVQVVSETKVVFRVAVGLAEMQQVDRAWLSHWFASCSARARGGAAPRE